MISRCYNPANKDYPYYGAKGITVCSEWQLYTKFKEDMGKPSKGMTLGRINNTGNYCRENCRWETRAQQASNKGQYVNNKAGITGVCMEKYSWISYAYSAGLREVLYRGKDFFEACCARKSWEAKCKFVQ